LISFLIPQITPKPARTVAARVSGVVESIVTELKSTAALAETAEIRDITPTPLRTGRHFLNFWYILHTPYKKNIKKIDYCDKIAQAKIKPQTIPANPKRKTKSCCSILTP